MNRILLVCLALVACLGSIPCAGAQDWPSKPVRFVVPFSPGGATDILARQLGNELTKTWNQQVVVDNRPGAGGNIGTENVVRATADGYTVLVSAAGSLSINPILYKNLTFDVTRDLAHVTMAVTGPMVIAVHPSLPVGNLKQLLALAKAQPGKINYGSAGTGSVTHLGMELINSMGGVKIQHVPYKGSGQALVDLIGGHIQLMFDNVSSILPHIRSGKVKPIAVNSRTALLPDIPAVSETLAGYEAVNWWGVMVPAKTPPEIVRKLHSDIVRSLKGAAMRKRLAELAMEPVGNSPEEFARAHRAEIAKWGRLIREAGISLD